MNKPRFIRIREVTAMTGMSRSHVYALIARGEFPKQIKLGRGRASAWIEEHVIGWMNSVAGCDVRVVVAAHTQSAV